MAQSDIATDEIDRLIASNKVEGITVYNHNGEKLGSIDNFMADKRSDLMPRSVAAVTRNNPFQLSS